MKKEHTTKNPLQKTLSAVEADTDHHAPDDCHLCPDVIFLLVTPLLPESKIWVIMS